jgi:hypothetical protein
MGSKNTPSAEHEHQWAEDLASLTPKPSKDHEHSLYTDPLPGMKEYREEMEARQAEVASRADFSEDSS